MFGNYTFGAIPYGLVYGGENEGGGFNYRHLILTALKQNLEAITVANGFRADVKRVIFGQSEKQLKNGEILIYSIRDAAVLNYNDEQADFNSSLVRSSSRIRNIYVKFRLFVKSELSSEIPLKTIELRENYADALIKGLLGRYAPARQLCTLLRDGISNDSGLIAFEILAYKEYGFAGDLELEAEVLLQYKEKFY